MQSKIGQVVSVAFALLIVFGLVGSFVKPDALLPAAFLVFTVLGWAAGKIVNEGIVAGRALHAAMKGSDEDKSE